MVRYNDLQSGKRKGCRYCSYSAMGDAKRLSEEVADQVFLDAGLEPLEPYVGSTTPRLCRCMTCGREVSPSHNALQNGQGGCKYCATVGLDRTAPGIIYLLRHESFQVLKIGVTTEAARRVRLDDHERHGWEVTHTWATDNGGDAVRLLNPLVVGDDVLRTSLRPGLVKAVAFNESHRRSGVTLFEIGHVYPPSDAELPAEYEALCVVIAGAEAPRAVAVWRELASVMGWGARLDQSNVPAGLHPTRSATLSAGRDVVGAVGEIHPDVLDAFDVTERVAVLELDLSILLAIEPKVTQWKATSRFPSSDVDLAFNVPSSVSAEKVDKALRQAAGSLLVSLELFDVYRTEPGDQARTGLSAPSAGGRSYVDRRRHRRRARQVHRCRWQVRCSAPRLRIAPEFVDEEVVVLG